jgi:hypothetical protein
MAGFAPFQAMVKFQSAPVAKISAIWTRAKKKIKLTMENIIGQPLDAKSLVKL